MQNERMHFVRFEVRIFWVRTAVFLGLVALLGIVYVSFELTPSSYGLVLTQIGAPEEGPVLGTARYVRSDEWAFTTPFFQAAVRNGFQRFNQTSFYREDLRSPSGLPLKDWAIVFKPEMWAFFVVPPALAFSIYWALVMCGCLAGYCLLFRELGASLWLAAAVALLIFFSGFGQFWWTTFAPEIAGLPWILLIILSRLRWWQKALLLSWALPVCGLAYLYPAEIAELAFAAVVVVLAIRPSLLRSPGDIAAIAIGGASMALVLYGYYIDVIPIMRNTVYPGHRVAAPGTATLTAVLSQFSPYLSFRLSDFQHFRGQNICEIAAVGSFLPLLTLCLTRYRAAGTNQNLARALTVLFGALLLVTAWEISDMPRLIGHILLWDMGPAQRLLLTSGFLITVACVLVWSTGMISFHPARIAIFLFALPIVSIILKRTASIRDFALCGFIMASAAIACLLPARLRAGVLVAAITLTNVYAFGRFNPLQPAGPIFDTPDTELVRQLHQAQDSSPEHVLIDRRFLGATPNGMGFRSVSHALQAPQLAIFRNYFPAMDGKQFNFVFNRWSYVQVTDHPLPDTPLPNIVNVPGEAFEPVRNLRQMTFEMTARKDCSIQKGGAIDRVTVDGGALIIEGWAPWKSEDATQELHVLSTRALRPGALATIRRPDVAEKLKDYGFTRAGFRLNLGSADGRALTADEVVLVARNTTQGLAQLRGCGCDNP
jgi:hypothetical protein